MKNLIKAVYAVYGDDLPNRSDYSSEDRKPFPVLDITAEFKTWAKFEIAYTIYAIKLRNTKALASVVTKPAASPIRKAPVKRTHNVSKG